MRLIKYIQNQLRYRRLRQEVQTIRESLERIVPDKIGEDGRPHFDSVQSGIIRKYSERLKRAMGKLDSNYIDPNPRLDWK